MARTWLRRIAELDPVTDHHKIYRISVGYEFPFDYQRALEFALFRTYCVPSISALLAATGEFEKRPQQRYDDTALLMAEIAEHGYDSERGKQALRVVNRAHGRYTISNDDMLYVLSTFVYDPVDWIDEFGWRPLHAHERDAGFYYFQAVGKRMGIKDIPPTFADFRRFKADYEREHFRYSDTNHLIGRYTLDLFCSWFPKPLHPAVSLAVRALLDEPMLTAFGFRAAPTWLTKAAHGSLKLRAAVVRRMPERTESKLAQDQGNSSYPNYPNGYTPADLGAPAPTGIDPKWLRSGGCPVPRGKD